MPVLYARMHACAYPSMSTDRNPKPRKRDPTWSFLGRDDDFTLEAFLHLDAAVLTHKTVLARLKHHTGWQVAAHLTIARVLLFKRR